MSEPWTAEQRQWLEAMGHTVWSMASADAQARPESGTDAPVARGAMREAAELLARGARPAPARTASRTGGGDRLMQALLRAAAGADEASILAIVGDVAALRGDAAAKRALWPRLRALRAGTRA